MATVIERERSTSGQPVIVERGDGGAGWAVALVIVIAALAVAGFAWTRYYRAPAPQGGANINLTIPSADTTGGGNASGDTGGAPAPAY